MCNLLYHAFLQSFAVCLLCCLAVQGSDDGLPVFALQKPKTVEPILAVQGSSSTVPASSIARKQHRYNLSAEETIRRYLENNDAKKAGKFHVQGWRWHTMSVVREAGRLQKLACWMEDNPSEADIARLEKAADYVVNFNLKALHRVEAIFFPFIRQKMSSSNERDEKMELAIQSVLDGLEKDQEHLSEIGNSIMRILSVGLKSKSRPASVTEIIREVARQSAAMAELGQSMLEREVSLVIPFVGRFIREKDQKKFNNQVIKFLGVLDSRCHLVHMHEVVAEANSTFEMQLWKESIPSFPRSMIPRWKRSLYEPRASMLDVP